MDKVEMLDCTLRDGGYINDWNFKNNNIKKIICDLRDANIEIIECGFLSNKEYNPDRSVFDTIESIESVIPQDRGHSKYVCMINYGEYAHSDIPHKKNNSIDGIRVAFHKPDLDKAIEFCCEIASKGYLIFVQPMVTIDYTDCELLELIEYVNKLKPYALYIVDSFGVMKKKDMLRIFYLMDHNLDKNVLIGYHAHNNLQLAYSNAQSLIATGVGRSKIVDTSVFGMGRGAGNLNTELFVQYLNDCFDKSYKIYPLLQIIDDVLINIYSNNYWGYSLPHYLSAVNNCHPNYASFLSEKNTLTIRSIDCILSKIPYSIRGIYKKEFMEKLYLDYQAHTVDDVESMISLRDKMQSRKVLIVGPGRSLENNYDEIESLAMRPDVIVISVNFKHHKLKSDYIFIGNEKRFKQIIENNEINLNENEIILTSNIKTTKPHVLTVNYFGLLNNTEGVRDNSMLMLLKLLHGIGVIEVFVAGFDGYSYDAENNYANPNMILPMDKKMVGILNDGIMTELANAGKDITIKFLTPTVYLDCDIVNKNGG